MKTPITVLILSTLVLAGCNRETSPPHDAANPNAPTSKNASRFANVLYVAEGGTDDEAPITEISFIKPHKALLRLHQLQVGRAYQANWRLLDASGKEVLKKSFEFVPTEPSWNLWQTCVPEFKAHKPGKWKWTVEVNGAGRFKTEVRVLAPTADQLEQLTLNEQAREVVFRTFANYWLGQNGNFYTMVFHGGLKEETLERKRVKAVQQELDRLIREVQLMEKNFFNNEGNPSFDRPKAREAIIAKGQRIDQLKPQLEFNRFMPPEEPGTVGFLSFVEVSGLNYSFAVDYISDADKLNGLRYKGTGTFNFKVHRRFKNETGWNNWADTAEYNSPYLAAVGHMMPASVPGGFHRHNLQYTVIQKDGHWQVVTDSGDFYVNGKRTKVGADQAIQLSVPKPELVKDLVQNGDSPRRRDQAVGNKAKATPEELEQNALQTISELRGRPL